MKTLKSLKLLPRVNNPVQVNEAHRLVFLKFTFTDLSFVPPALARRSKRVDLEVDQLHAAKAVEQGKNELAEVGRAREGRVDTGIHAVADVGPVQVSMLRRGLAANGYLLKEAYCFQKKKKYVGSPGVGSDVSYVVVLEFEHNCQNRIDLLPEIKEGLREMAKMTWQYCHVWDNAATHGTITVNLGGLCRYELINPKFTVVIRNHTLQAIPITKEVSEEEEE